MKNVDQIEQNGQSAIDEERELHTTLCEGIFLRNRESAELTHLLALVDHGAEGFDVRWDGP